MPVKNIASIDIGSTYTKGACFRVDGDGLEVKSTACVPTTQADLAHGFDAVLATLTAAVDPDAVRCSSSAKGGLAIAAVGIVPELTTKMAHQTALSAGARISRVYSYKLTPADVDALAADVPDIILFTGGFDGGNEDYVRHNAGMLAAAELHCPILYAGNRVCADAVREILSKCPLRVADNVLPSVDAPNPEPARDVIREMFLETITRGKGLDVVASRAGSAPRPTPLAMLELVANPALADCCVIDLGGATTDFYSHCPGTPAAGVTLRGLPEPPVKRSVEGDLGMRISAAAVLAAAAPRLAIEVGDGNNIAPDFAAYVNRLRDNPARLPADAAERRFDAVLASACIRLAAVRHAGTLRRTYTPDGEHLVQRGKDLRAVRTIVATGGYLSRHAVPAMFDAAFKEVLADDEQQHLLPTAPELQVDRRHLLPLLANLATDFPDAVAAGVQQAVKNGMME